MTAAEGLSAAAGGSWRREKTFRWGMALAIVAAFVTAAAFSPSPGPLVCAGASLAVIIGLLWRRDEPSLLLAPALLQWTSVAVKPIQAMLQATPLNELADYGGLLDRAAYLGFACVSALAVGLYFGSRSRVRYVDEILSTEALLIRENSALGLSFSLIIIGHAVAFLSAYAGPLRPGMLALSSVSLQGLFLLSFWSLKNNAGYVYMAGAVLLELVVGFTGFFAGFKDPVLILAMATLAASRRLNARHLVMLAIATLLALSLASFWSEVKVGYRGAANEGSQQQVASASLATRLDYLIDQAGSFGPDQFADGFGKLISRISYIDFLADTMTYVPTYVPHEHGAHTLSAILNSLTPRIFFPDKPPTPADSEVTAHYTGLDVNRSEGTSISIGYVGELYIDFGFLGAIAAAAGLGLAAGLLFKLILYHRRLPLIVNVAMASTFALSLDSFDTAMVKFVGGFGLAFCGAIVVQRYVLPLLIGLTCREDARRLRRPAAA